jgi:N-acetylmuramoyl-L-alanine amidase
MKIFVYDRKKHYVGETVLKIIVVLLVSMSIAFGVVVRGFGESLYVETVNPDESRFIILDAGHGGEDSGACGADGSLEKDVNLALTLEIGRQLSESGYTVIYTRTDDRMLYSPEENVKGLRKISDLKNRAAVAAEYPHAIFISIHTNSYGDARYKGLQVYYSANTPSSRTLADRIQKSVREALQTDNDRTIKQGDKLYLLKNIENPAVIIECGFMSNTEECKKLSEKEYQKQLSFSIVCGIIEYMKENSR